MELVNKIAEAMQEITRLEGMPVSFEEALDEALIYCAQMADQGQYCTPPEAIEPHSIENLETCYNAILVQLERTRNEV